MFITTSIATLDGLWLYDYTGCMLGRVPRTKETLPDFFENMDPDKWNTIVWYRVVKPLEKYEFLKNGKCKTRENSNFWKKGKIVISVKNPKFII